LISTTPRRLVLVLALVAGVLTIALTRPQPASAWTVQHDPDAVVLTSERLHDETVRATIVVVLQRDGDIVLRAQDVHNSGATRKFYKVDATIKVPAAGLDVTVYLPTGDGIIRIGGDTTQTRESRTYSPTLFDHFDTVHSHQIEASLHLDARRVGVQ
jgi:hypothetical protein